MTETPVKIVVDLSKPKGERESIIPLTMMKLQSAMLRHYRLLKIRQQQIKLQQE
tara:strand:+ start:922 stop:1083 length:162 start_codon:yes stop_codon:yes gene_type:complete